MKPTQAPAHNHAIEVSDSINLPNPPKAHRYLAVPEDIRLRTILRSEPAEAAAPVAQRPSSSTTQPLPVAAKTACAFVMGVYGGSKDAMGKAQAAFEGGFGKSGEYTDLPALQRVFTSFEEIEASLNHWATSLYEPIDRKSVV